MSEFSVYALKGDPNCDVFSSLRNGEGRFGWSTAPKGDLRYLQERIKAGEWDALSEEEQNCYQRFLLDLKKDDYVVYINVPDRGRCTLARVTGPYAWRYEDEDFNHRFPVDPSSVFDFDRNDAIVHPVLSARLKLQGRYWRIFCQKEFEDLVSTLKDGGGGKRRTRQSSIDTLGQEIQPHLADITAKIHRTHPNYDLEKLLEGVFRRVPGVNDVKLQGGAGDHGADLLVFFESGLPIEGFRQQHTCVVQVKSFEGQHSDVQAVKDIQRAFERYPEAEIGLIVSTATCSTDQLDNALEELREKTKKTVVLLIGAKVASFVLRFGNVLL